MTTEKQEPIVRGCRFGTLDIAYDDRVLAPRPWTALQSQWAAELAESAPYGPVLELCAGAGQIGLLTVAGSERRLVAVDLSATACGFIELNAAAAGLADRVEVRNLSLDAACTPGEVFPVIVADPPWVPTGQTGRFPEDPRTSIDGGADGLDLALACLEVMAAHLHPQGFGILQVGSAQQVDCLRTRLPPGLGITDLRVQAGRGVVALVVRAPAGRTQATPVADPASDDQA